MARLVSWPVLSLVAALVLSFGPALGGRTSLPSWANDAINSGNKGATFDTLAADLSILQLAEDTWDSSRFGDAVAIDGDWAVVGAPRDDGVSLMERSAEQSGHQAGGVYLYKRRGKSWIKAQKLLGEDDPEARKCQQLRETAMTAVRMAHPVLRVGLGLAAATLSSWGYVSLAKYSFLDGAHGTEAVWSDESGAWRLTRPWCGGAAAATCPGGVCPVDWELPLISGEFRTHNVTTSKETHSVSFEWSSPLAHDVHKFPDKAAYDACDFTKATQIGDTSPVIYDQLKWNQTEPLYFGCSKPFHCTIGHKLTLNLQQMEQSSTTTTTSTHSTANDANNSAHNASNASNASNEDRRHGLIAADLSDINRGKLDRRVKWLQQQSSDDIPTGHTPPPGSGGPIKPLGCGYKNLPRPVLARCTEGLHHDLPDLRGSWEGGDAESGDYHWERIEQCGDRIVFTSGCVVHDFRHADGTLANGTNDYSGVGCVPIKVAATYDKDCFYLKPLNVATAVTRCLNSDGSMTFKWGLAKEMVLNRTQRTHSKKGSGKSCDLPAPGSSSEMPIHPLPSQGCASWTWQPMLAGALAGGITGGILARPNMVADALEHHHERSPCGSRFGSSVAIQTRSPTKLALVPPGGVLGIGVRDVVLAVGAPYFTGSHKFQGAVHVYVPNDEKSWVEEASVGVDPWTQQTVLTATSPQGYQLFGSSVAVSLCSRLKSHSWVPGSSPCSDRIAIGARGWKDVPGTVYVFERCLDSGCSWEQKAVHTASDSQPGNLFGQSIALDGDTLVVGAPLANMGGMSSSKAAGAVYPFSYQDAIWREEAVLTPPGPWARQVLDFGHSVALHTRRMCVGYCAPDTIVIGAPQDDGKPGEKTGAVYTFIKGPDNVWKKEGRLTPPQGEADRSLFGSSVAIKGDNLIVGSPLVISAREEANIKNHVSKEVFKIISDAASTYVEDSPTELITAVQARLEADHKEFNNKCWLTRNRGSVWGFFRDTSARAQSSKNWSPTGIKLTPPCPLTAEDSYFGSAIAMDNNHVMIGAPFESSGSGATGCSGLG